MRCNIGRLFLSCCLARCVGTFHIGVSSILRNSRIFRVQALRGHALTDITNKTSTSGRAALACSCAIACLFPGVTSVFAQQNQTVLDTIVVEGETQPGNASDAAVDTTLSVEENPLGPSDGLFATTATTATRLGVPINETPRSITVITREQLEDQGAQSVEEAISYTPGVLTEGYGLDTRYDSYAIRGFEQQNQGTYRDGMPLRTLNFSGWRTEMFGVERIEVLRGPTADLYGANQPGGIVNIISKRPQEEFSVELQAGIAYDTESEIGIDVTGPIGDLPIYYRFIGLLGYEDTRYDEIEGDRIYIAPSITFAPTEDTSLTIFGQYQKDKIPDSYQLLPEYGTQLYNPIARYGPDTFTGDKHIADIESEQSYVAYEFEHSFSDALTFRSRGRYGQVEWDNDNVFNAASFSSAALLGFGDPTAVDSVIRTDFQVEDTTTDSAIDAALEFKIENERVDSRFLVGVDYYYAESDSTQTYTYRDELNLLTGATSNIVGTLNPLLALPQIVENDVTQEQTGVFILNHTKIDDSWILSGGLRYDWIETTTDYDYTINGVIPVESFDSTAKDSALSGSIGLAYETDFGLTPYANYINSFSAPPGGIDEDGNPLKAETARQYELGFHYSLPNTASTLSVALFDIEKSNIATSSLSVPGTFVQTGEARSRGIEIGGQWDLPGNFSAITTYTYLDTEITDDPVYQGNELPFAPHNMASAWLKYDFVGNVLEGLSIAGGVRYVGERYSDNANDYKMDPYTLFDAALIYEKENFKAALTARNLFDTEYVSFCADSFLATQAPGALGPLDAYSSNCSYGKGLELEFKVSAKF